MRDHVPFLWKAKARFIGFAKVPKELLGLVIAATSDEFKNRLKEILEEVYTFALMLPEDLPFRVIRVNSEDEVIARANNLLVGRAAYETAVRLYPRDTVQYRAHFRAMAPTFPHPQKVGAAQARRVAKTNKAAGGQPRCHQMIIFRLCRRVINSRRSYPNERGPGLFLSPPAPRPGPHLQRIVAVP